MQKSLLASLLAAVVLQASEPSAFGAGDIDNPEPYGLTPAEKNILKNKKTLENVKKSSQKQATTLGELSTRIDGMNSILEGLGETSHRTKIELVKLKEQQSKNSNKTVERLNLLEDTVAQNRENIEMLKNTMVELSQIIDGLNANVVTREEYNKLVDQINSFKKNVTKELKNDESSNSYKSVSSPELAKDARKLYDQKYYTKSIPMYEELIARNYKPARAHYMIGEMWYYRKKYDEAIAYFKKSAQLYDKASYMPILMYHSAVAMSKTGDNANAKTFLRALLAKYPESSVAVGARKMLEGLE